MTPIYGKSRFPKIPGNGLCRGCHQPVPKGRQTWCSNACYDRFCPRRVLFYVRQRDKHVCQICGERVTGREEYDHIIPFSEGGLTVLENMRTLCHPCHVERTKQWRLGRASKSKREAKQVLLPL